MAYNITRAIMKFPKGQAVEAISSALEIGDRNIRRRAAKLLGELRHKKSVSRLAALLSDPDPAVRYEAVEALRKIGDVKVLGRLISCLGDESVDVRYGAIQALRSLGDERAVEPLIRICLENETSGPMLWSIRELWEMTPLNRFDPPSAAYLRPPPCLAE